MKVSKSTRLLNLIFDVNRDEWPRITLSWLIRFVYRISFVVVWTVLVATFVGHYGIASLPYLFALVAVFTVLGSVFFSTLVNRLGKQQLMILNVFLGGLLLFAATLFVSSHPSLFFGLLIVAVSVFMVQFSIALNGYVEDLFSALQSERTFPLIESSETFGGIFAGLVVVALSGLMAPHKLIYIAIGVLFSIVPMLLFCDADERQHCTASESKKLLQSPIGVKQKSFMRGLFFIVFFQWILFNLFEFQYTKAVYQNVSGVILDAGGGFEHAFVHDLGLLFALFSATALFFQLFVAGRLIKSLGVVGSMMLHPIVTLLSLFGMTASFSFTTAVLARNNFAATSAIHKNAYHSLYYSLREGLRGFAREFYDGMIRPFGAIVGTLLLILLQLFFVDDELIFVVNAAMIVVTALIFYVTLRQQKKYIELARLNIPKDIPKDIPKS